MNEQKSLVTYFSEAFDNYRSDRRKARQELMPSEWPRKPRWLQWQLIISVSTVLVVVVLLLTVPSLAAPLRAPSATSTSTISYQGRLADSAGNPLTDKYNMEFRIYDVPTGGTPLWTEMWTGANAVDVSDGLFNVMLGSIDNTLASSIEGYDELYLGITVGTDSEMVPRVQLGSVPFSMQAMSVSTGAITTTMLADGTVTLAKLGTDVELVPTYEGFSYYTGLYSKPMGWHSLIVDTLNFNTFGAGTYDTATGTFTAPKAGYYRFMIYGFLGTGGANNERIALALFVNGGFAALSGGQFSAGDTPGPHFSHVVYLETGDTISISSYTPIDCVFGGVYPWWFQGEYLGE
jgi:hypothetical protein